ncbi:DUF3800 domain-containing protein [Mycetocola lacteus]|uniref:DUF3800 domain-containing protein n=1 Tax=Mycetocola lacteus TaxID=76637 RepID=A0A3L7AWY5_9MICO|nr:DUF3800 domain-containing protein [Mycetocola lacteus]RLP83752.1 DUF3800 domain-containing protein [Mycetocola lacteus]
MRAIYIDESGRDDNFYFFGGLVVEAESLTYIDREMEKLAGMLARNIHGFDIETEFHAVEIFQGTGPWKKVSTGWRVKTCKIISSILASSGADFIFRGIDITRQKEKYVAPFPAHLLALAHLLESIDNHLFYRCSGSTGIVLADDHHSAASSRKNLSRFKLATVPGYVTKQLTQIHDTLYFGPSDASRLLQAADVATYFLNRANTIEEKNPDSARAIETIVENIRSITRKEAIWPR